VKHVRGAIELARPSNSLLVFLSVFIPLLAKTKNLNISFSKAVPLLFISMCTFIANDVDDVERDQVNHPERALASGRIALPFAASLYFVCLAVALFTTRSYIVTNASFWYYLLLILAISYRYVVVFFAGFKALYVAGAVSIPVLIVATYSSRITRFYFVAASAFCLALGRELCMDLTDRLGDTVSFMHRLDPKLIALIAFSIQVVALLLLTTQVKTVYGGVVLLSMSALLAVSGLYWFKLTEREKAIAFMKILMFVGLYFLV
jgi:hypothetical protein